jgi:SPP1 family predicted phage head-tail adaptor
MRAGTLNRRALLESREETSDEIGEPVETWTSFATVWCAVEPAPSGSKEIVTEAQVHAQVQGRIRIRFLPGVAPKMRATVDSVVYNIIAVLDLKERHEEMYLLYSQGLNDG